MIHQLILELGYLMLIFMGVIIGWLLFINPLIHFLLCFFSYRARYRKWDGYYGLFYLERPFITTTGHKMVQYCKDHNIDILKQPSIPQKYLQPTEKELGPAFKLEYFQYLNITKLISIVYARLQKARKSPN